MPKKNPIFSANKKIRNSISSSSSTCNNYFQQCEAKCLPNEISVFDCDENVSSDGTQIFNKQCKCVDPSKNSTIYKKTIQDDESFDDVCENLQQQCIGACNTERGILEDSTPPCSFNPKTNEAILACACDDCEDDNLHLKIVLSVFIVLAFLSIIAMYIGIGQTQRQNKVLK
jgi:hypothetical protein